MRITAVGHAGLFVETEAGSILCDPWFTPAFFASWFPFPRNDRLDPEAFSRPDYLYISHTHRDHLDTRWLSEHVDRSATVLLPEFGIDELEVELAAIGFDRFVRTRDRQPVEIEGLTVAIISLAGPNVGPMGDSALWVDDGTTRLLNQNDAHPSDLDVVAEWGGAHVHALQYSGAIWWPMVYEVDEAEKQALILDKRQRQFDRAIEYVRQVGADHVLPTAGPPCFLDDELSDLNELPGGPLTIFPDAPRFLDELERAGIGGGHLLVPGSRVEFVGAELSSTWHPIEDPTEPFTHKAEHLDAYRSDWGDWIEQQRSSWPDTGRDLVAELAAWFEPLLVEAPLVRERIGIAVLIDADDEQILLDIPSARVTRWQGEPVGYTYRIARPLIESMIERRVEDWCNEVFLSCRFRASREGPFNEPLMTFFKSLSPARMAYAENHYGLSSDEIEWVEVDGWCVERSCPHQRADLTRFGYVEDGVLECGLHGWRFDLATGRCLNAEGTFLKVRGPVAEVDEP